MEKRGLSAIIATLIIILLTLVAVGVIWVVVQNLLRSGAEQIELGQYTLDLEIKSVQITGENVTVVVKRNAGEGEFIGMNFIFSNGTDSEIIRENTSLNKLDTKTFTFILTKISTLTLKTVSVVPIYKTSSGKESSGNVADEFSVPANKSLGTIPPGTGEITAQTGFEKLGFAGTGKIEYTVSGGTDVQFKDAIVNPLDVMVGQLQTFTVTIYSPNNILNVTSFTQLDTSNITLNFIKISDDGAGTSIWSVNWTAYDTHNTEYKTKLTAIDSLGNENNLDLTWTDTDNCNSIILLSDQGKDKTLTSTCAVASNDVSGVMGGAVQFGDAAHDITVTLNSGSIFVTKGFSFYGHTSNLATAADHSATIYPSGYLYLNDGDGDRYATSTTLEYSASASLASHVMANNTLGTSDCNDASDTIYGYYNCYDDYDHDGHYATYRDLAVCTNPSCTGPYTSNSPGDDCNDVDSNLYTTITCYYDNDQDGYYGTAIQICTNNCATAGPYSSINNDCVDTNPNVPPGPCY